MQRFNTQKIDEYLKKHSMTKTLFCKKCGICPQTLKKLYDQKWKTMLSSNILKIAKTIDCKLSDLF